MTPADPQFTDQRPADPEDVFGTAQHVAYTVTGVTGDHPVVTIGRRCTVEVDGAPRSGAVVAARAAQGTAEPSVNIVVLLDQPADEPAPEAPAADAYVRTVAFVDGQPDDGDGVPIHVTAEVRFDGAVVGGNDTYGTTDPASTAGPLRVRQDQPITVATLPMDGAMFGPTVVTMTVHAEDVTMPNYDATDPHDDPARIGGRRVLIPHPDEADHRWAREGDWVRVSFFARTAAFEPAEPAEAAERT